MIERWQLKQRQSLPLEVKIEMSLRRIRQWYEHWEGQVYVSFSGGKDSTVLLHLVRSIYPEVNAVFVDTGLEYPEIRAFVKTIENVVWLRPKIPFHEVIKEYGYPVFGKEVALRLRYARQGSSWAINNLKGLDSKGVPSPYKQGMYAKYEQYLNAPFKISDKCCDVMKEKPFRIYEKETSERPFIGLMAGESQRRQQAYLKTGCNSFNGKLQSSKPIAFWTEEDIWEYISRFSVPYSKIYDMGEKRTGCMFCMFGVHLEPEPNRFQRMADSHPKQYKYCMEKLGMAEVLEYIKVPYWNHQRLFEVEPINIKRNPMSLGVSECLTTGG